MTPRSLSYLQSPVLFTLFHTHTRDRPGNRQERPVALPDAAAGSQEACSSHSCYPKQASES